MGWFLLYLFVSLQVAACLIAVVARVWKLTPEPIVWRGTDLNVAGHNVQQFLIDIDDSRFAYPTGMFLPDPTSAPEVGRIVMREANFKGSHGVGWALRVFATFHLAWQHRMAREGSMIVVFAWPLWMMLAAFLAAPFLVAAVLDIGYRRAFRSRIEALVTRHPEFEDAVEIRLEFSGLSAFGLVPDVLGGMAPPVLPEGLATRPADVDPDAQTRTLVAVGGRAAAWAQGAEQRFRVIYGSAIGAALLVALVLALTVHHGPSYGYAPSDVSLAGNNSPDSGGGFTSSDGTSNSGSGSTDTSTDTTSTDTTTDTTTTDTTTTDTTTTDTTTTATTPASSNDFRLLAGLTGHIVVRAGPSSRAAIVGQLSPSDHVTVVCTSQGDAMTHNSNTESTWDRIAHPSGFVSDTLVQTGSSSAVAPACKGSNSPPPTATTPAPKPHPQPATTAPKPAVVTPSTDGTSGPVGPTPAAPRQLASTTSPFRRFSVRRPDGDWVLQASESPRPGYVDTRWHLRGSPNVLFVVDYIDGFGGDAVGAANNARELFTHAAGYQQLNFSPLNLGSTVARRWEYTHGGQHWADLFFVTCNTSFAVRGATPVGGWSEDWNQIFYSAAASLSPSC